MIIKQQSRFFICRPALPRNHNGKVKRPISHLRPFPFFLFSCLLRTPPPPPPPLPPGTRSGTCPLLTATHYPRGGKRTPRTAPRKTTNQLIAVRFDRPRSNKTRELIERRFPAGRSSEIDFGTLHADGVCMFVYSVMEYWVAGGTGGMFSFRRPVISSEEIRHSLRRIGSKNYVTGW